MSYVIDRRLNGKNKSTVNRQRFLRRYRDHIKKAVEEAARIAPTPAATMAICRASPSCRPMAFQ